MKILTWNIKHGGTKNKLKHITNKIIDHNAGIIVLTEFRTETGQSIQNDLKILGWPYQISSNPPANTNGISAPIKIRVFAIRMSLFPVVSTSGKTPIPVSEAAPDDRQNNGQHRLPCETRHFQAIPVNRNPIAPCRNIHHAFQRLSISAYGY